MTKPYSIAMLLTNPFRPDPRVQKEAISLINAGYKVTLICWDRLREYPQHETIDRLEIIRIQVKSRYSAGSLQVVFLFFYLLRAFLFLLKLKPHLVHCHDLDTCFAGIVYSKFFHVPWIFDAHECYPEQIGPQVNHLIYKILIFFERFMAIRADHVITVGNILADHFRKFGAKVTIVGNYPLSSLQNTSTTNISRSNLLVPENVLLVSYIGGFTLARAIVPLLHAVDQSNDFYILLAGDGPQRKVIDDILRKSKRIIYLGWINQDLVPAYLEISDIVYYGLKINDGNSKYSVPNTLFITMAVEKPILTTDVGEISKIVKEEDCGVVISQPTTDLIIDGIRQLSQKSNRDRLGKNGKSAFLNRYNWETAEANLLGLYMSLLN